MRVTALTLFLLLLSVARAGGQKPRLSPEQLGDKSTLIVVGEVLSHSTSDQTFPDGGVIRTVHLKVRVESVAKGDAKPGDVIRCRCQVLVKAPRGVVMEGNPGHEPIPGDGGRARFHLSHRDAGSWLVADPNGAEPLDQTPPLRFERQDGDPLPATPAPAPAILRSWPFWLLVLVSFAVVVLRSHLKRRRSSPSA